MHRHNNSFSFFLAHNYNLSLVLNVKAIVKKKINAYNSKHNNLYVIVIQSSHNSFIICTVTIIFTCTPIINTMIIIRNVYMCIIHLSQYEMIIN